MRGIHGHSPLASCSTVRQRKGKEEGAQHWGVSKLMVRGWCKLGDDGLVWSMYAGADVKSVLPERFKRSSGVYSGATVINL